MDCCGPFGTWVWTLGDPFQKGRESAPLTGLTPIEQERGAPLARDPITDYPIQVVVWLLHFGLSGGNPLLLFLLKSLDGKLPVGATLSGLDGCKNLGNLRQIKKLGRRHGKTGGKGEKARKGKKKRGQTGENGGNRGGTGGNGEIGNGQQGLVSFHSTTCVPN